MIRHKSVGTICDWKKKQKWVNQYWTDSARFLQRRKGRLFSFCFRFIKFAFISFWDPDRNIYLHNTSNFLFCLKEHRSRVDSPYYSPSRERQRLVPLSCRILCGARLPSSGALSTGGERWLICLRVGTSTGNRIEENGKKFLWK